MQLPLTRSLLCALAALTSSVDVAAAFGFADTSPAFFFSTQDIDLHSSSLKSASSLLSLFKNSLWKCPSDFYLLVNQPGVHVSDFTPKRAMPRLKSKLLKEDAEIKSSGAVDGVVPDQYDGMNVVGTGNGSLRRWLEETCGTDTVVIDGTVGDLPSPKRYSKRPTVIEVNFQAPSATDRFDQLYLNDAIIASLIELLPSSNYTVIYSTTPVDPSIPFPLDSELESRKDEKTGDDVSGGRYKFDQDDHEVYQDADGLLNSQVRRDTSAHQKDDKDKGDKDKGDKKDEIPGGVFERYQFLSPGIFMGFMAGLFFVTVIYVGVTAITGLEISYASFAKDNSPQASKKAQ